MHGSPDGRRVLADLPWRLASPGVDDLATELDGLARQDVRRESRRCLPMQGDGPCPLSRRKRVPCPRVTALLPGTQVKERGLRWEVVFSQPAGEHRLYRLERGLGIDELDVLSFEMSELDPRRAARLVVRAEVLLQEEGVMVDAPLARRHAARVGSPLEHDFLRLFERHDFHPDPQVPILLEPTGPTITVADFAVECDKLAIYVDGAAFHTGPNLRRDRRIRLRLKQAGWRVEELTARDLARGAELVASLRRRAE